MLFRTAILTTLLAAFGASTPVPSSDDSLSPRAEVADDGTDQLTERRSADRSSLFARRSGPDRRDSATVVAIRRSAVGSALLRRAGPDAHSAEAVKAWLAAQTKRIDDVYNNEHAKARNAEQHYGQVLATGCNNARDKNACLAFYQERKKNDYKADEAAKIRHDQAIKAVHDEACHANAAACH